MDGERGREEKRAEPAERARRVSPGEERDRAIEGNARRKERESNRGDDAGAREARRPHGFLNRRGHTSRYVRFTYTRGSIITGQTGFPIHQQEEGGHRPPVTTTRRRLRVEPRAAPVSRLVLKGTKIDERYRFHTKIGRPPVGKHSRTNWCTHSPSGIRRVSLATGDPLSIHDSHARFETIETSPRLSGRRCTR